MSIAMYPVKIEGYDDATHEALFIVEAFDEGAENVTISTVVDVALWDELAPKIREALVSMKLEGADKWSSPPKNCA